MPRKVYSAEEKAARQEYSRLRAIANKRIARLEKAGFESYQKFPTLKELGDLTSQKLGYLRGFVASNWTRSGFRKEYYKKEDQKTAQALQDHGYNIPASAIKGFTKFMENWRRQEAAHGRRFRASDQTAQVFENAIRLGVDPDEVVKHMKAFINHAEELARMEAPENGEGLSFKQVQNKWKYEREKAAKGSRKAEGKKRTKKKAG